MKISLAQMSMQADMEVNLKKSLYFCEEARGRSRVPYLHTRRPECYGALWGHRGRRKELGVREEH